MISNTSPLINLGMANALNLIPSLFPEEGFEVVIPTEVINEIKPPLKNKVKEMQNEGHIIISPFFISSVMNSVIPIAQEIAMNAKTWEPEQHYTEAYVIVKGEQAKLSLGSAFVLIDEKDAKTIAKQKGLRVMNHIDIIRECVRKEIITQDDGLHLLETLVSKGIKYRLGMLEHYKNEWS